MSNAHQQIMTKMYTKLATRAIHKLYEIGAMEEINVISNHTSMLVDTGAIREKSKTEAHNGRLQV